MFLSFVVLSLFCVCVSVRALLFLFAFQCVFSAVDLFAAVEAR